MYRFVFICLWITRTFSGCPDFDCVVVGTSPICMLEALYRWYSGNSVLIVEKSDRCGGAWKSINICGINHADLGCHEFGTDRRVKKFLEEYIGCTMIETELSPQTRHLGLYPSRGCYELTYRLQKMIEETGIVLLLSHQLNEISINPSQNYAEIKVNDLKITTNKILITSNSEILFNGIALSHPPRNYPHLYLLIQDPNPAKFTYHHLSSNGVSRAMNLTEFVGLDGTDRQLIVLQLYGDSNLQAPELYMRELIRCNLINPESILIHYDSYVYTQTHLNTTQLRNHPSAASIFEVIDTGHIAHIGKYIEKWTKVLKPLSPLN